MASQKKFDILVIGGGLSGLLAAAHLARVGKSVALVEASENLGGTSRGIATPMGLMEHSLKILPDLPATREAIGFLEQILGSHLSKLAFDSSPITFQKGHFQPFVGFGGSAPDCHDALEYYLLPQKVRVAQSPRQWVAELNEKYVGTRFLKTRVTHIEVVDKAVRGVILNGQDAIEVDHVIYCGPLRELPTLLSKDALSNKTQQKIAGANYWTSIGLDLIFNRAIGEAEKTYVLYGGGEDIKACVGHFLEPVAGAEGQTLQHSHWLTFLADESTNQDETAAGALKDIKRQLKRAFGEEVIQNLVYERILVTPRSHGAVPLKLEGRQNLPEIKNLSLCSPLLHAPYHLVGLCLQVKRLLEGFGISIEPEETRASEVSISTAAANAPI